MTISVVVPVLGAIDGLTALLEEIPRDLDLVVVDGAGDERVREVVNRRGSTYVCAAPSRGGQILAGLAAARHDWLWVLHADSSNIDRAVVALRSLQARGSPCWGRFDVTLPGFPIVAFFMNWRSRLTRICTGDQGMFMHRSLVEAAGGFPSQPLMEDIEMSRRLKAQAAGRFVAPHVHVETSSHRWRERGALRTVLEMWRLRYRYFRGADPVALYEAYYGHP